MYQLLLSEFTFRQGTPESAREGEQIMLETARRMTGKTPDDEALFKRATQMAVQAHSATDALEAVRAWRTAFPRSVQANRYELEILIGLGQIKETADPLRHTLEALPTADREEFIAALPLFYERVTNANLAAQTVERALGDALKSPNLAGAAWSSIGRLRLQAGDENGALNAATLGSEHANSPSPWPALLALQLMANGHTPEIKTAAETLIKNYLQATANTKPNQAAANVQLGYARALANADREPDALAQLEQLTTSQPDFSPGWLVLGSLYMSEGQPSQAQTALERYLTVAAAEPLGKQAIAPASQVNASAIQQRRADMDTARLLLAQLAQKRGDIQAANQWLSAVQSPGQMLAVAVQRASLLADQGRIEEGRALIRAVPNRSPDDAMLKLRAEAHLLSDHQRAADAYKLLSDALTDNPNDNDLIYDAALAAGKAGHLDDEERLLNRLIKLDPSSAAAYNALGYDLADRGLRLQEAKQLIEKAAALAPDDALIRDSLGWVQYRLGNLQEARRLLEDAFQHQPDPEIAAHLGEVLWTQGEHDAAREVWRKGLALDAKNETLQKTLTRLKVTLP